MYAKVYNMKEMLGGGDTGVRGWGWRGGKDGGEGGEKLGERDGWNGDGRGKGMGEWDGEKGWRDRDGVE